MISISRWLVANGVASDIASDYVVATLESLVQRMRPGCDLDAREHTTSGGLYEMFRDHLIEAGILQAEDRGLDRVLASLQPVSRSTA